MTSNFEGVHVHVRVVKINLEQSMYKNLINMVGFFLLTSSKHYM